MMIERHYDEEALIALLETNRAATDTHLPACPPCFAKLESFQMIAEAMRDRDVWDTREVRTEAVPATIATLRAFADRMTAEDAQADQILPALLAGPRETWMARLQEHPEWRTAGVVRRLIAAASRAIDTMPPDAVQMTTVATAIADDLDVTTHPSDAVHRLRGAAWREYAYALFYTGRFAEAEKAVFASERHFSYCVVDEYEQARTGTVRALTLRALERFSDASVAAERSGTTFLAFEDLERSSSALLAQVHVLFSERQFAMAASVLQDVEARLRNSPYALTHAITLGNLGYCWRNLNSPDRAIAAYEMSTAVFEGLNVPTEAARNRWSAAGILVETGRIAEAHVCLDRVRQDFERYGMASEAALVSLDVAELLLAEERFSEVEAPCRRAIEIFEEAGVSYTARALTALAFMSEAIQRRTVSRTLVKSVKDYIRRLPEEPQLLFAPPPP